MGGGGGGGPFPLGACCCIGAGLEGVRDLGALIGTGGAGGLTRVGSVLSSPAVKSLGGGGGGGAIR
jgi:hypothetical protein